MSHKIIILLCILAFMITGCSQSPQTENPTVPTKKIYKIVISDRSNDVGCENCWSVNVSIANIVDQYGELLDQALIGENCRAQSVTEDWVYCEFDDYTGWVKKADLIQGAYDLGDEQVLVVTDPIGYLINQDLSETPVAMNTVLRTYFHGSDTPILPSNSILRGIRGAELREADDPFPQKQRLALCEKSYEFIGQPYTWGGITAVIEGSDTFLGPDCSGFVQSLFRFAGLDVPRDANEQYQAGCPITWEEIQPGDTVYQLNVNGVASHVGIATTHIAEDGTLKIIDSDYPDGVSMKHTLGMWKKFEAAGYFRVDARKFFGCENIQPYKPFQ